MTSILVALILFVLGAFAAVQTSDGHRNGIMPALISSRVSPFRFERVQAPAWFRGAIAINVVMAAALTSSGIVILAAGVGR